MTRIIIGTTPTITYTFKVVPVSSIVTAMFTVKQNAEIVLQKTLSDAVVGENTISWTLTQEETLALGVKDGTAMMNWLTDSGKRGIGEKCLISMGDNHIREVMT